MWPCLEMTNQKKERKKKKKDKKGRIHSGINKLERVSKRKERDELAGWLAETEVATLPHPSLILKSMCRCGRGGCDRDRRRQKEVVLKSVV